MKRITLVLAILLSCSLLLSGCGTTAAAGAAASEPSDDNAVSAVEAASEPVAEPAEASFEEAVDAASALESAVDSISAATEASDVDVLPEEAAVSGAEIIEDISTVQAFTDAPVAEEDITSIVNAGINAPSAMNSQPWHFSVVTNPEIIETLSSATSFGGGMSFGAKPADAADSDSAADAPAGAPAAPAQTATAAKAAIGDTPLVIVVSCSSGSELDAGLATQNMSAEAQLLGYGTKILTSPKLSLNSDEYKTMLGVPEGMSVACVLLVGVAAEDSAAEGDEVDAVTSATTRNPAEEVVTYLN